MSLILDALRRADRSRERDVGRRVTQTLPPRARPRPLTRIALFAALAAAIAVGFAGWHVRPARDLADGPVPPRLVEIEPQVRGSSLAEIAIPEGAAVAAAAVPPAPMVFTLPAAVRASLPPLTVDAHVWSDNPAKRFVMLNGRLFREGDVVEDGLHLVAVVADGAELEWRGVRFRVPAQ